MTAPALAIAVLLLARFLLLGQFRLLPEEAYYWMYAQHLAACFVDHPPMVAWLIAAGTSVFGDTEFGVRIAFWLLATASVGLCYMLGDDWGGRRAGLGAAVIFSIAPLYVGTGFLAMPDAPLLFFWLLVLVAVTRAVRNGRLFWWLLAGTGVGLAFVAKYPGALLAPSTLLFLLSSRRRARMLATPGPWVAAALAVLVALPVIWWNWQHDWASFEFQLARRYSEHQSLRLADTAAWLGTQLALLAPPVFILLMWTLWVAIRRLRRDRNGRWQFAACFAIPWLLLCFWHGLYTDVKMNWPLPAYLSLLPVASILVRTDAAPVLRRLNMAKRTHLLKQFVVIMAIINVSVLAYVSIPIPLLPRPDILQDWREVGRQVAQVDIDFRRAIGDERFIATLSGHQLAGELAFYMSGPTGEKCEEIWPAKVLLGRGASYRSWVEPNGLVGKNALLIADEPISPLKQRVIASLFQRTEPPVNLIGQPLSSAQKQSYWAMRCYGFRGLQEAIASQPALQRFGM